MRDALDLDLALKRGCLTINAQITLLELDGVGCRCDVDLCGVVLRLSGSRGGCWRFIDRFVAGRRGRHDTSVTMTVKCKVKRPCSRTLIPPLTYLSPVCLSCAA
jgi:hypothetical protein